MGRGDEYPPQNVWQDEEVDYSYSGMDDEEEEQYGPGNLPPRFDDPLKFLPIIFVLATIVFLYYIFVVHHCIPMLQLGEKEDLVDDIARQKAILELVVFNILTLLVLVCYAMCILMHPGTMPDDDVRWDYDPPDEDAVLRAVKPQELKRSGDRRHCKWCGKYKPDRCHHCRVCRICVLKMDHHCPWIYNCVGFKNYKPFFLLLFYAMLDTNLVFWAMLDTTMSTLMAPHVPFDEMFIMLFAETVAAFFAVLVSFFLCFHLWLVCQAMTTIEFCEKALPKEDAEVKDYDPSRFDLGYYGNLTAVLGKNPLLWLVPCSFPDGDGCTFNSTSGTLSAENLQHHAKAHYNPDANEVYGYSTYGDGGEALLSSCHDLQGRRAR